MQCAGRISGAGIGQQCRLVWYTSPQSGARALIVLGDVSDADVHSMMAGFGCHGVIGGAFKQEFEASAVLVWDEQAAAVLNSEAERLHEAMERVQCSDG